MYIMKIAKTLISLLTYLHANLHLYAVTKQSMCKTAKILISLRRHVYISATSLIKSLHNLYKLAQQNVCYS